MAQTEATLHQLLPLSMLLLSFKSRSLYSQLAIELDGKGVGGVEKVRGTRGILIGEG